MPSLAEPGADLAVDANGSRLALSGAWTLPNIRELFATASAAHLGDAACQVDARALTGLDTAGALLLVKTLQRTQRAFHEHTLEGLRPEHQKLFSIVASSLEAPVVLPHRGHPLRVFVEWVGMEVSDFVANSREVMGFVGLTLWSLGSVVLGRRKLRLTATVFHMEHTGLHAVPIVALLCFLVGAVVAFLGATVLKDYGASIYTIDLVGYSFLREFGVLLTAILLAGRSGSAFTAQIGSMKSREEIDAIHTLGLDPMELLVLPRLVALLAMLPLLSFLGTLSGIVGGAVVGSLALGISPGMFISRLREATELRHLWVGLVKAPVFAFVIAIVGCMEGLKVEGSAESVGRRTTMSVVQSIFLVILFDALFAIWFMEMNL